MDFSPPGSSIHGILQARVLERVAINSSLILSLYNWHIVKWPGVMKKDDELIQGSRGAIKMLSILTFKLIG